MEACLVGIRLQNMVLQSDLKSQWRLEMAKRRGMCRKPSSAENLNRRTRLSPCSKVVLCRRACRELPCRELQTQNTALGVLHRN